MIAIIDYKAGNLTSVKLALEALKVESVVTSDKRVIEQADKVVFPGVGAAKSAMDNLRALALVSTIKEVATQKPFLGICLGMQILFDHTEEDGGVDTLGLIPGKVRRFPNVAGFKVPEIGWNDVGDKEYYFVHSYYAELCPWTDGKAEYAGIEFTASVKKGQLWATQFHPEKSGRIGLEYLKEFLAC